MPRKEKGNIKQKILDSAEVLFASHGFDATGIDLIAKTAGITKSLIYYYFKSKDEILSALFEDFINKTVAMKEKIVDVWVAQPTLKVDQIIRDYSLPFMMENKNLIKIAFSESIKEVSDVPHLNIFKYFDQNFSASYDFAQKMGFKSERNQAQMISSFFLFFAPLFSFVIFSDEWCDHYNVDLESVSALFADSVGRLYSAFTREVFKPINLNELKENYPQK